MRPKEEIINALLEMGGSRWTRYGKDRIYLSRAWSLIGFSATRYNTGNISSASLEGEAISNTYAKKVESVLESTFIDIDSDFKVVTRDCASNAIVDLIKEKVDNIVGR